MFYLATILTTQESRIAVEHTLLYALHAEQAHETARSIVEAQGRQKPNAVVLLGNVEAIDTLCACSLSRQWPVKVCDSAMSVPNQADMMTMLCEQVIQTFAQGGMSLDSELCQRVLRALMPEASSSCTDSTIAFAGSSHQTSVPKGPRIIATFVPQAYAGSAVVEIEGRCPVDVTEQVLNSDLVTLHTLLDNDASSDKFIDVIDMDHAGPYSVDVERAVCQFFQVHNVTDISERMLSEAQERWQLQGEWSIVPEPQLIVTKGLLFLGLF